MVDKVENRDVVEGPAKPNANPSADFGCWFT